MNTVIGEYRSHHSKVFGRNGDWTLTSIYRKLSVLEDVYKSESDTNGHNRAIAELLTSYDRFYGDVDLNLAV